MSVNQYGIHEEWELPDNQLQYASVQSFNNKVIIDQCVATPILHGCQFDTAAAGTGPAWITKQQTEPSTQGMAVTHLTQLLLYYLLFHI